MSNPDKTQPSINVSSKKNMTSNKAVSGKTKSYGDRTLLISVFISVIISGLGVYQVQENRIRAIKAEKLQLQVKLAEFTELSNNKVVSGQNSPTDSIASHSNPAEENVIPLPSWISQAIADYIDEKKCARGKCSGFNITPFSSGSDANGRKAHLVKALWANKNYFDQYKRCAYLFFVEDVEVKVLTNILMTSQSSFGCEDNSTALNSELKEIGYTGKIPVEPPKSGLILGGLDISAKISIDGKEVEYNSNGIKLPLNKEVQVVVSKQNYKPFVQKITWTNPSQLITLTVPEFEKYVLGKLSVSDSSSYNLLKIVLDGVSQEFRLPITELPFPVGNHSGVIYNQITGSEKKVDFIIKADEETKI